LIFTASHIRTEPTHFLNDLALEHADVRRAYEIAAEQGRIMVRGRPAVMRMPSSIGSKPLIITTYKSCVRMFLETT